MKIMILGGTLFLSHAVAAEAVARGHDVVCAARGVSGEVPDGARLIRWDRNEPVPAELARIRPDAVVDVSRTPEHVRRALAAFPDPHWTFVSTITVYADVSTPNGTPETLPLLAPAVDESTPDMSPESYGRAKVACENLVREQVGAAFIVRPGLIVGPGDPSGRFAYWPSRFAQAARDGSPVLVPEPQDEPVQLIDVRDLATWIVDAAEQNRTGVYDGVGAARPRSRVLAEVAAGVGAAPDLVGAPEEFLAARDVVGWSGPRSLPLWIGDPDWTGMLAHDADPSTDAGLRTRPIAATARDILTWLHRTPDAPVTGLSRTEELELLDAL